MKARACGIFVIPWSQTELDGLEDAPLSSLVHGAAWSWRGQAIQMSSPNECVEIHLQNNGLKSLSAAQAQNAVLAIQQSFGGGIDLDQIDQLFIITNGARSYTAQLLEQGTGLPSLLAFAGDVPLRDTEFWVHRETLSTTKVISQAAEQVVVPFTSSRARTSRALAASATGTE